MTSSPASPARQTLTPAHLLLTACNAAIEISHGLEALAPLPPDQQDLAVEIDAAASELVALLQRLSLAASSS